MNRFSICFISPRTFAWNRPVRSIRHGSSRVLTQQAQVLGLGSRQRRERYETDLNFSKFVPKSGECAMTAWREPVFLFQLVAVLYPCPPRGQERFGLGFYMSAVASAATSHRSRTCFQRSLGEGDLSR